MADLMQIYIINLDRSPDRMAFVEWRFADLGLRFVRIAATDGASLSERELQEFASKRPRDGKRGWRPGQVGCLLSHVEAWKRIVESDQNYGLIVEDDVHLSDALPEFVANADWIPTDGDIVRLESTGQWLSLGPITRRRAGRVVRRVRSPAWATGAYVISKAAAARLLTVDPALHTPVDDFLFNLSESQVARLLVTYQLTPALAIQDKFNGDQAALKGFGSEIETETMNQRVRGFAAFKRGITSTLRGKSPIAFR